MKLSTLSLATFALLAGAQPHHHAHVHDVAKREASSNVHQHHPAEVMEQKRNELDIPDPEFDALEERDIDELEKRDADPGKPHGRRGRGNHGLSYDPIHDDGTYKNVAEITQDFRKIKRAGYGHVRSYRTDFGQVKHMIKACKATGLKLFPGTTTITDVHGEISAIINQCRGNWRHVHSVGVGNELVNSGQASAGAVIAATNKARGMLRGAGYGGPVVSPDTFIAYMNNPSLCSAGDYVAANCHAYFDGHVTAQQAAGFVRTQHGNVVKACGGKKVKITESGWPSQGGSNGAAIPSPANQKRVANSIRRAFRGKDITLFMAFNEPSKTKGSDSTFGTEPYWGILS